MTTASKFKLEISLDNDAFKPEACIEIARILRGIAGGLETYGEPDLTDHQYFFHDDSGNRVGFWWMH